MSLLFTDVKKRLLELEEENTTLKAQNQDIQRRLDQEVRGRIDVERMIADQAEQILVLQRQLDEETKKKQELLDVQARAGAILGHGFSR